LTIKYFKIFGERHTGTNAVSVFLRENFNLSLHGYDFLGWKHRLAPKSEELDDLDIADTLFVFCFRHPFSWLKSMHKEPYSNHYPKLKELDFIDFISAQIEDYRNVITLWNEKNQSYLDMSKEIDKSICINVEDFFNKQEHIHNELCEIIGTQKNFIRFDSYVNGRGLHTDQKISESLMIPSLNKEEIQVINSFLSKELLTSLNYEVW